jgi:FtsZ-interacting cell division protein ZipA
MKSYLRFTVLFAGVAVVLLVLYLARQATEPESAIIAREKDRVFASRDKDRMQKDPVYAGEIEERMEFLDYQTAAAYNAEHNPDKAIPILQRLIDDEEAREKAGTPRRSRSYMKEADYYEALQGAYELKQDEAAASRALDRRTQLRTKAAELRKKENKEEGKYVGSSPE